MEPHHTLDDILSRPPTVAAAKTCLVVDDSAVIRRVASQMFEELGYTVSEAADGAQALERCREQIPDLILLDWNMPVMDGLSCLLTLRDSAPSPMPRIMLCTTENTIDKIQTALTAGADEYIIKPFDRDMLHDKLVILGLEQPL